MSRRLPPALAMLLAGAGLAAVLGCGSGNPLGRKAISGKVTLDGNALERGTISFEPEKPDQGGVRSGAPIAAGQYSMPADKGLPPGKYVVRIFASAASPGAPGAGGEKPAPGSELPGKDLVPPQYNAKSDLVREVTAAGPNQFDFDLKSR